MKEPFLRRRLWAAGSVKSLSSGSIWALWVTWHLNSELRSSSLGDVFVSRSGEAGVVNPAGVDGPLVLSGHAQMNLTPHAVEAVVVGERAEVRGGADLLPVAPGPLQLPFTRTVVFLLKVLPLHSTKHWYSVWSSSTVRHTVKTEVWHVPFDWRQARALRSSSANRETDSEGNAESAPLLNLNHFTFTSRCLAPWTVHLRSVGN
ncbi:hypothetical protein EYF80_001473 [Liparis tanakae]|uniref:Uncharacterized protein n=1 Tax=Liparis tanakae TaxID=230148 RepID=A0A4Z2JE48_9TELE|nr:hypothetical protein EYF80_001473 [Liparis tanakae]